MFSFKHLSIRMNSNPEKPRKAGVIEDGDILSSFHDSILCHILSLMPTKDAARTSILSKRWKFLFLDVPKLAFSMFPNSSLGGRQSFIDFVNRRLTMCKTHSSIAEFRLVLPKLPKLSVINTWIITLLFRNLKVVEIKETDCSTGTPQRPPSELFGWETLVVLKLRGLKMVLKFPTCVIFPNLKVLKLEYLEIQSESKSLRFDQQGYPLLKTLQLGWVRFECSKDNKAFLGLVISSRTLKTFEIVVDKPKLERIDIDAPQLRHLKYHIWEVDDVSQVQLTFRKTKFLMSAWLFSEFNPRDLHIELLSKMNGVKNIRLIDFDAKDLPYPYSLPHFANLKYMDLCRTGVESMLSLLRSAPKLQVLTHHMLDGDECFVSPTNVPLCLAQELKHVTISNFLSYESDVECVRFFLQHGAILESLTLEASEWSVSTLEQLLKLPRCSPKCEIVLHKEDGN